MDHAEHLAHHDAQLALLTSLLARQQDLQAQMLTVQDRLVTRQDDQAARAAWARCVWRQRRNISV